MTKQKDQRRGAGTGDAAARDAGTRDAGAAVLKKRSGGEEERRRVPAGYRARVFDHATGAFLLECRVTGKTLGEAESRAIAKAALSVRGNPAEMEVRHLHECGGKTTGQECPRSLKEVAA